MYTDIAFEQPKKAVIYARFSSSNQTEQSIEGQLTVCNDYAEKHGYQVINNYIDRAISGRSDDRPDFQRMIDDARSKAFQYILVYKLDRFSRNRYDSAHYKAKLKKYGVKVISCMENIGDNPESVILEAMLEGFAEYYSIDLAQKVKRGLIESAKKGRVLSGAAPLGYRLKDHKLVIDPDVAPHVKWAFESYAAGMQRKDIVEELNRRGIRSPRKGTPITASSLQTVFKNEKYIGILDQQGIRLENNHEAIIDKTTFDKVQSLLEKNRHYGARSKATSPYLLTGKLFCGMCGKPMRGVSGAGRSGDIWYYYSCKGRKDAGCKKRHEKKDYLEWYVCEQTVEYILQPPRLRAIAKAIVEEYKKIFDDGKLKETEKQLNRINAKISRIVDMLIDVPKEGRQPLYDKLEALGVQKSDLELELAKQQIANKTMLTDKQVEEWLKQFCKGDLFDMSFREKLIDVLINSIYLFDDKVILYYNVTGGKQISFIEMLEDVDGHPSPDEDFPDPEDSGSYFKRLSGDERLIYKPFQFIYRPDRFGLIVYRK